MSFPPSDFPRRLSDFNLSADVSGPNVGDPGQALGGQSPLRGQLQEVLAQRPTFRSVLGQALGRPQGLLAGALGAVAAGLAPEGQENISAFSQGLLGGLQGGFQQQLEAHEAQVKSIAGALEAEEKARQRIATLVGQAPGLFANVDPAVLSNVIGPDLGVEVNPGAKLAADRKAAAQVEFGKNLRAMLPLAEGPRAKAAMAQIALQSMGFKNIPQGLVEDFWRSDGNLTADQLLTHYPNASGVRAALILQQTGEIPWRELGDPVAPGKNTKFNTILDMAAQVDAHINDVFKKTQERISIDQAIVEALPEAQQEIFKNELKLNNTNQNMRQAVSLYANVNAMIQTMAAFAPEQAQQLLAARDSIIKGAFREAEKLAMTRDANFRIQTFENILARELEQAIEDEENISVPDLVRRARAKMKAPLSEEEAATARQKVAEDQKAAQAKAKQLEKARQQQQERLRNRGQ